jgi:trimethylamine---corrinoid protein Co-methyltransferase
LAGANLIYGMGMLELGLTFDFGQMVVDNEIAAMNRRVLEGVRCDSETLAVEVIKRVGSEGHFLREKHTREFLARGEQTKAGLFDRRSRGAWEGRGGADLHDRALARAREILRDHQVPPLPDEAERVIGEVKERVDREVG